MEDRKRTIETGWLPLRDSYEEAVLSWYEQVENSFRRREEHARRPLRPQPVNPAEVPERTRQAFD